MNPDHYQRVSDLFSAARRLPPDKRDAYLDDACGGDPELRRDVDRFLKRNTDEFDILDREEFRGALGQLAGNALGARPAANVPTQFGQFRIIRIIGEGGMGTVFEAEQENPRRTVALKVIRTGLATPGLLRRFEHEAHVLGRLQHPGIAQVFEAGTTDAGHGLQPFFAMEFIRGRPLLEHFERAQLGTKQRLALFAQVCDAIEHAHQKGVIHRDLKPANILVDESNQPKVLDFGVARATDSDIQTTTLRTDVGQLIGTVPYMSPEQVVADPLALDTRSDVYALGVLAYEMLAGRLPYDLEKKAIHEAVRVIREEEPTRLSAVNKRLRGDVETIVAKALEKDRTRRYQSASALAEDIRRYLKDEPITARPPSAMYQLRKFSSRNRVLVGSFVVVLLVLFTGAVVSAMFALGEARALKAERKQRLAAEAQASRARKTTAFLQDMLGKVEPSEAQGEDVTVREVLDATATSIDDAFKDEPEVEAAIRYTIGSAYTHLGVYDQAEAMLERVLELRRSELEYDNIDTINALNDMGTLRIAQGRHDEALIIYKESVALSTKLLGPDSADTLTTLEHMGNALAGLGQNSEVKKLLNKVLAGRLKLYGPDHEKVTYTKQNMAVVLKQLGDYSAAETMLTEALAELRKHHGDRHPTTAVALQSLADVLTLNGRFREAEPFARESVDLNRILYGDAHPYVARALLRQAKVQNSLGRYAKAESILREALEIQEKHIGSDPKVIARTLIQLADQLRFQDRHQEAEPLQRRALGFHQSRDEPETADHAWAIHSLVMNLVDQRRFIEAEELQRKAVKMMRNLQGNDHPSVTTLLSNLGNILHRKGDHAASAQITREVLQAQSRLLGEDHPEVTVAMFNLAVIQHEAGDFDSAETLIRRVTERFRRERGDDHPHVTIGLKRLASIRLDQGELDEAIELRRTVLKRTRKQFGNKHQQVAIAKGMLGAALGKNGNFDQAEELLLSSHTYLIGVLPAEDHRVAAASKRLAELYHQWKRPADASKWQTEFTYPVP